MSTLLYNTVERLDRPSAYYVGKVGPLTPMDAVTASDLRREQKKRRYQDELEEQEDPNAKLRGATTLYVGNL